MTFMDAAYFTFYTFIINASAVLLTEIMISSLQFCKTRYDAAPPGYIHSLKYTAILHTLTTNSKCNCHIASGAPRIRSPRDQEDGILASSQGAAECSIAFPVE